MNFKKLIFAFVAIGLTVPVYAQLNVEQALTENMQKHKVIGMSVAAVKNGEIVYNQSFGLKNLEDKTPLANTDIFRIASISKSFSATTIMQLVEAKKLSLDDDFSDLIGFKVRNPKYPDVKITLKMVLSHTSSINDSEGYFTLDPLNPDKNPNWAKGYNDYAPGKGYQYCNLNYNMVGAVIERYTGERFDNYVKKQVLDPLGLYAGYWVDGLDHNRFANLYEYNAETGQFSLGENAYNPRKEEIKNYVIGYSAPIFSPTGGLKIGANDLAKYMIMHMNYGSSKGVKIISKKSAKIMQTKLSNDENYGLGLLTTSNYISGKSLVGHTGSAYGLYSAMFWDPKTKNGFIVITNGSNPTRTNGTTDILRTTINILNDYVVK